MGMPERTVLLLRMAINIDRHATRCGRDASTRVMCL